MKPSAGTSLALPKATRCPCCGYGALVPCARAGRVVRYRNTALTLPAALRLLACRRCKYQPLGLDTLPPALLETLYQASLRQRVAVALDRLQSHRPQRRIELLINLSQGYLSRLKAGDGAPGAPLVSLLALLAAHPQLIAELERYWTLPPNELDPRSDTP